MLKRWSCLDSSLLLLSAIEFNLRQEQLFQRMVELNVQSFQTEISDEERDGLLDESSIKIRLDVTSQHTAITLQGKLLKAFQNFTEQLVRRAREPI